MLRKVFTILVLAGFMLGGAALPVTGAAPGRPALRLIAPEDEIDVEAWAGEPVYLDSGIVLGVDNAPLELKARRNGKRFSLSMRGAKLDPTIALRGKPAIKRMSDGLDGFFEVVVADDDGNILHRVPGSFCPNGWRVRLRPSASDESRYPDGCGTPVTTGAIWGIEQGWGAFVGAVQLPLSEGHYTVTTLISARYAKLFDALPEPVTVGVTVSRFTEEPPIVDPPTPRPPFPLGPLMRPGSAAFPVPHTPRMAGAAARPDLVALPAWNIGIQDDEGSDQLVFASTVWNAGPGPLVVDGFRRQGEMVMEGYQSFYLGSKRIGTVPTGELEYDERDGHQHWHFKDFAAYRLLDASKRNVVLSEKESFCLAATDMVDVLLPGAALKPNSFGLHTSCGERRSLSIREVLDAGWGDTYYQSIPGQAFDVTELENGVYYIQTVANQGGSLHEVSRTNNTSLRRIVLSGEPGDRTVRADPISGLEEFDPHVHF